MISYPRYQPHGLPYLETLSNPPDRSFPPQTSPLKTTPFLTNHQSSTNKNKPLSLSLSLSLSLTMKGISHSSSERSYLTTKRKGGFQRYLKPGALAQLRDSRIVARWQKHDLQTHIDQLLLHTTTPSSSLNIGNNNMPNPSDVVPCFSSRTNYHPRCLQRKKLVAVTPVFHETTEQL